MRLTFLPFQIGLATNIVDEQHIEALIVRFVSPSSIHVTIDLLVEIRHLAF
jgi:hypothetical protein